MRYRRNHYVEFKIHRNALHLELIKIQNHELSLGRLKMATLNITAGLQKSAANSLEIIS